VRFELHVFALSRRNGGELCSRYGDARSADHTHSGPSGRP
jgi:hypothetical protein